MQQKRRRILRAIARNGGSATPGQLYSATGMPPRTGSRVLGQLRDEGIITGSKHRIHLTPTGWAEAERAGSANARAAAPQDSLGAARPTSHFVVRSEAAATPV
jgi:DNA-binding IclR family transcriptional regulator